MSADSQKMLTPAEVADLIGANVATVGRLAREGHLISVPTPGGHRRYPSGQFAAVYEARRKALEAGRS